ncbi:MAG TPA: hypothetical protein VGJ40_00300 [Gaiellaceae bacterium]|jgi:hypothetical protein
MLQRPIVATDRTNRVYAGPAQTERCKILCQLVVNQTIAYVDRGHASKTYALELAQPFRVGFRAELFG